MDKKQGSQKPLYTLAPEFQNHCILYNQAVALDSKEELSILEQYIVNFAITLSTAYLYQQFP
jgi:hypothetical protein